MCHRQFVDDDGSVWAVWDVYPARIWEALKPARHGDAGEVATPRRAAGPLDRTLASGWLCFESAGQKLRLAPIPTDWEALASTDLVLLRKSATAVQRTMRPPPA